MGDSKNVQQPSKKRAALKELSRENPGLDDEENSSELESGTFKVASEQVLATRRIVKVKRKDPSAAGATPASNPFAGIRLVPSTAPVLETTTPLPELNPTPTEAVAEDKQETHDDGRSDVTKEGEKNNSEAITAEEDGGAENKVDDEKKTPAKIEDAAGEETENAKDANQDQVTDASVDHTNSGITNSSDAVKESDCVDKGSGDDQTEKEEKEANGNENTDKNGDWKAALSSFQQHSSGENAFTGLASTGFATSSFSFGSAGSDSKSLFPKNTDQPPFNFGLANNGNSSLFGGSSSTSITTKSEGTASAFPSKQEVSVETGEENEEVVFTADSVMFEYLEGGWKERGKGELKVNVSTTGNGKARLVMRSKGNYRLILNASLYPEMKLASMDKKGITFACVNSISEAKNGLSTLALKFKDPSTVEEFRAAIEEHKDSSKAVITEAASAPVKTPENSPRTEDV